VGPTGSGLALASVWSPSILLEPSGIVFITDKYDFN
jgi:hypothetical protein